ncbi:DUF397 domain-containing protein [Streptomyces scopuliridis]|uniref:DUF397 domain-containing protein n=1 Tax=Streptomyces scopuliridis TaxID=452529 RepID=UPI003691BAA9
MTTSSPPPAVSSDARWVKASVSSDNGACVEVATARPWVWVRDSKDLAVPPMAVPEAAFTAFVDAIRARTL